MNSFKRLSPTHIGSHLVEELRQRFEAFWHNRPSHYQRGGWAWSDRSGFDQLELIVCDLDSDFETAGLEATGYLAIEQLPPGGRYRINCVLDKKFATDAEVVSSKIFDSASQAKAFLDSVLAFETPSLPAPVSPPHENMTESEFYANMDADAATIIDLSYAGPETVMPEKEFKARLDSMIEAQYEALGIEMRYSAELSPRKFALAMARIAEQVQIEFERDPIFEKTYVFQQIKELMQKWVALRRPKGAYRPDGVLPISENLYVFMSKATRDNLLDWELCEKDERNLAYIKSRLEQWDAHPECTTLAELEKQIHPTS